MAMDSLRALFEHGLMDVYDAEHRVLGALAEMSREATDLRVRELLDEHHRQTQDHLGRLRRVFDAVGREPSGGEGCHAVTGILLERKSLKEKSPSAEVLLRYDLATAAKLEHYEIAAYEDLVRLAERLELRDLASTLGTTLSEERDTLRKVDALAHEDFRPTRERPAAGGRGSTAGRS